MKIKVNLRSKLLHRPCTKALCVILKPNKLKLGGRRLRFFIRRIRIPALLRHRAKKIRMEDKRERGGAGDSGSERLLFRIPSPSPGSDVEDACRSFQNYLVEMILEEGKLKDLMDVEELLFCWKKLKSPVFSDLVSRFYSELCRDLFTTPSSNMS